MSKAISFQTERGEICVWKTAKGGFQIRCISHDGKIAQRLGISMEAAIRLNQSIGYLIVKDSLKKTKSTLSK